MSLELAVRGALEKTPGTFGVAAWNSVDGVELLINEHESFPSASVIKVPILVEIFCRRDEGTLSLDERFILRDADKVEGSGTLKEMHEGLEVTLRDLAALMIVTSDNTATNMIIERLTPDSVTARMRSLGLQNTVLARKMYDWEQQKLGRENVTTPHDMMQLLRMMAEGRISRNSTCSEMIEIMARQQYRERIPYLLPEKVKIANKTGSISGITHDVGIVYAPKGPYVLCVMAKGLEDWRAGQSTIAQVSRMVYDHWAS